MKKTISFLLVLVMSMTMLVGCGSKEAEMNFTEFQVMRSFGDLTEEVLKGIKAENGVKEVVEHEDGSLTVTMGKKEHDELLKGMKEEMDKIVANTETAADFVFIKKIEPDNDYSHVNIFVDKGELEVYKAKNKNQGGEEILEALSFSLGSVFSTYKAYANQGEEVEIKYVDEKSKDELETIIYPEFFKEKLKENDK